MIMLDSLAMGVLTRLGKDILESKKYKGICFGQMLIVMFWAPSTVEKHFWIEELGCLLIRYYKPNILLMWNSILYQVTKFQSICRQQFNPLPDDKILDWFKLEQIADNIFTCI